MDNVKARFVILYSHVILVGNTNRESSLQDLSGTRRHQISQLMVSWPHWY